MNIFITYILHIYRCEISGLWVYNSHCVSNIGCSKMTAISKDWGSTNMYSDRSIYLRFILQGEATLKDTL